MKLTKRQLLELVEEPFFSRGETLCKEGMIEILRDEEDILQASVLGNKVYSPVLALSEGELQGMCTCTAFREYGPCKHIAAAGLAMIAHEKEDYEPSPEYHNRIALYDRIADALEEKEHAELVDLLMILINTDFENAFRALGDEMDDLLEGEDFWA